MHPTISLSAAPEARARWTNPLPPLLGTIGAWSDRARGRLELARLDARMLRDIGVTPCDVARETGKPFWRA